jgi:hypothetical protein
MFCFFLHWIKTERQIPKYYFYMDQNKPFLILTNLYLLALILCYLHFKCISFSMATTVKIYYYLEWIKKIYLFLKNGHWILMFNILERINKKSNFLLQNGHTAQTIAKQLGRPAVLGALKRSCQIDTHQPLSV